MCRGYYLALYDDITIVNWYRVQLDQYFSAFVHKNIFLTMGDELTLKMHQELLGDEISNFDLRIMGVFGAMKRGIPKHEALLHYEISEEEYDDNIQRVLNTPA